MHDPLVMLCSVPLIRLDLWHREPGGHDAGQVCGLPPHGWRRGPWALRHIRHWHPRWRPVFRVRKWITDRCEECGHRFRWSHARYSYMSTDKVWHNECQSLRHVRSQLDDITRYVLATADDTTRWRVEYRLKHLDTTSERTET